jgi:hypothetical protein
MSGEAQSAPRGSVLGRRIAWRSLVSIGVTCLLVMVVQAILVVQLMQTQRLRTTNNTVDLMLPNLANAAWQINEANARALLQSLLAQPGVRSAAFRDETMQITEPAPSVQVARPCEAEIKRSLVGLNVGNERLMSGELAVCYVSPDGITDLLPVALLTTVPLLLVVGLAAIAPARLLQRMVISRLDKSPMCCATAGRFWTCNWIGPKPTRATKSSNW